MTFSEKTILGRTDLKVGRLGISPSFGTPTNAFEEAFERGCNYFTFEKRAINRKRTGEGTIHRQACLWEMMECLTSKTLIL